MKAVAVSVAVAVAVAAALVAAQEITNLPGYDNNAHPLDQEGGYITVDAKNGRAIYYWMIRAQEKADTAPLVFWFQGGPGCSGLGGLMSEQGPFRVDGSLNLNYFDITWTSYANMVFLEQPAGVGFSYSNTSSDYNTGDIKAAKDSHAFIKGFLARYTEFQGRDLWLTGESYGGVYVPTTASNLLDDPAIKPQFKGVMIGNGVIGCNSGIDRDDTFVNTMYWHGLVSYSNYVAWQQANCPKGAQNPTCQAIEKTITSQIGVIDQQLKNNRLGRVVNKRSPRQNQNFASLDPDDLYQSFCTGNGTLDFAGSIPGTCESYGDKMTAYLNRPDVQKAIHARPATWAVCTGNINYTSDAGDMTPYYIKMFNNQLHVLVYSGDVDVATVPMWHTQQCLAAMPGTRVTSWGPWFVNGHTAGYTEAFSTYTYATLKGAGHEAPQYQPLTALQLFKRYLQMQNVTYTNGPAKVTNVKVPRSLTQGQILRALYARRP